jgi:hypothetical protein
MAAPQWHAIPTAVIAAATAVVYPPTTLPNLFVLGAVVGLGFFVDGDHLSIRRIKRILRGERGPVPGWVNWAHTWWFLGALTASSVHFGNYLPLASYAIHMLIDGGDRSNAEEKYSGTAPLPEFLHRFCPRWAKYETKLLV